MAENTFRSYRNREPVNREPMGRGDVDPTARDAGGDPLAELARLIGQSDPNAGYGRDAGHSAPETFDDAEQAPGLDWAANEGGAEQDHRQDQRQDQRYAEPARAEDRYVPPPLAASYPPYASNAGYSPPEPGYAEEPQPADQYSGPAPSVKGLREDARDYAVAQDAHLDDQEPPISHGRQAPAFAPQSQSGPYAINDRARDDADDQSYASDDYDDETPYRRRRSGSVVVIAVLGLAVLGTAGAFAYRAMFGGSVLPTLPPIIRANDGPNKIVPPSGDARAGGAGQASPTGSGEKLVSREEQPVEMQEPGKTPSPRVVSTIPVMPGQGSGAPAPAAPPYGAPAPAPNGSSFPPAAPAPEAASPPPKKIHTVTIRPDQQGNADAAAAPPPPSPRSAGSHAAAAPRPVTAPRPPSGPNAPLALVPAQGDAPVRTRTALAHPTPLAPSEEAGPAPAAAAGGGYAVQVTSQRSEAEAQTAFRSLQVKYPGQLGGRHPIVRRADLGAKGTFYRALVGPYASMEQAAGVCSSLKAAGGNCIVQRN